MMDEALGLLPGYVLHAFETIDSTNDEAKRLARAGAAAGTLVWARAQSGGRGRRDREWVSPWGNLYLSIVVRPEAPQFEAAQLSFVAGLAVFDAIMGLVPELDGRLTLKWPNDILLDGAKCAGLLLESDRDGWLVVGIGINVASAPVIPGRETSCLGSAAQPPATGRFVEAIVSCWDCHLSDWRTHGFGPVREDWLDHSAYLGERIAVTLADETLTGIFVGLDEMGGLLLRQGEGAPRLILAGDVFAATQTGL